MTQTTVEGRLATKTPEAAFIHVMQEEFNFSPRVSHELLSTAKEMLVGGLPPEAMRPGQMRVVVTSLSAPFSIERLPAEVAIREQTEAFKAQGGWSREPHATKKPPVKNHGRFHS